MGELTYWCIIEDRIIAWQIRLYYRNCQYWSTERERKSRNLFLNIDAINIWPNCSYHCTLIRVFKGSKQTAVLVVGQLRVAKNIMNCLWQSRLTESKTPSSSIHSSSFFQACRHCKQLAKHNAKDNARPKVKVAYHCTNEMEKDLDVEDSKKIRTNYTG